MTTVVGIAHNDKVYIGGDSQITSGWQKTQSEDCKVFRRSDLIFGCSGAFRFTNIVRYHFDPPYYAGAHSDMEYICVHVVENIRKLCKELGQSKITANQEDSESNFLVAYRNQIYQISGDFAVNQNDSDLYTLGSGREYALGALRALDNLAPIERIQRAIEIAASFDIGTSGPITILTGN